MLNRFLPTDSAIRRSEVYLFMWSVSYGLMGLSSFVNAVIFIFINTKCRRQIVGKFSHDVVHSLHEGDTKRGSRGTVMGRIDIQPIEVNVIANTFECHSNVVALN